MVLSVHEAGNSAIFGSKKTNKQKTHKHFSDGPCGTIVPGTNPHPSQGQTGQNSDFTVELNRERPVFPRDGYHLSRGGVPFVPGTVPVCPGDRPAENVYVYWVFSCPTFGCKGQVTVRLRVWK